MSDRHAYYVLLTIACFMTGAGHYVLGPLLLVVAMVYRERIVASEERPTNKQEGAAER